MTVFSFSSVIKRVIFVLRNDPKFLNGQVSTKILLIIRNMFLKRPAKIKSRAWKGSVFNIKMTLFMTGSLFMVKISVWVVIKRLYECILWMYFWYSGYDAAKVGQESLDRALYAAVASTGGAHLEHNKIIFENIIINNYL